MNIDAKPYLPHRATMSFIDAITACDDEGGEVVVVIKEDCIFADSQGEVDEILLAEFIAQGYAALEGYRSSLNTEPIRKGFLVGIKKMNIKQPVDIHRGSNMVIKLHVEAEIDDYVVVAGVVIVGEQEIATAHLTLFLVNEDA